MGGKKGVTKLLLVTKVVTRVRRNLVQILWVWMFISDSRMPYFPLNSLKGSRDNDDIQS